jgi:hypothetical protein
MRLRGRKSLHLPMAAIREPADRTDRGFADSKGAMNPAVDPNPDVREIRRALSLICVPGAVHELRAPETAKATISGYFNDLDEFTRAAVWANHPSREAPGVYLTINPVKSDLLARSANALRTYAKHTTSDADIGRRVWLLIDFDPKRPSGISATKEEHEAALARALAVRDFLRNRAWSEPIFIDSGNGSHLLYRIELANEDAARDLIKRVLEALATLFDDEHACVDRTTFNAARIARIPGTVNRKGDSIVDRPHRLAQIHEVPNTINVVTREQLEDVAALLPEPAPAATGKVRAGETFDLSRWILEHGIEVVSESSYSGGRRLILKQCPFDPSHAGTSAALFQLEGGALAFKCQHNSCADKKWSDVREKFEPGYRDRRDFKPGAVDPGKPTKQPPQADELVSIARKRANLFHDGDTSYAVIELHHANGSHREVWSLRSRGFKNWLAHQYFTLTQKSPNGEALATALTTLEGFARFDAPEHKVSVRLAEHNSKIYLDLANAHWQAVEINEGGWRIVEPSRCDVYFRRPRGMLPLPLPEPQTDTCALKKLEKFLNIGVNFPLAVGWQVAALRPKGPYPAIALHGEQGSAKSSTARYLRATIDPNRAPMRVAPKDVRDLQIAAYNSWVVSFDNLSHIQPWLSDCLCRLSTGGGFSSRELYTDTDETILDATRPIIINGIEELTTRADLLDRAIVLELEAIAESSRLPERELDRKFEAMRPAVLGALLNAVSCALRNLGDMRLPMLPRMADFATWVSAAEPALPWQPGEFLALYRDNIAAANTLTLEASTIFPMLAGTMPFEGTSTELLEKLKGQLPDAKKKPEDFPSNARALSGALKRIAPNLRRMGVNITWTRAFDKSRSRMLTIKQNDPKNRENFASDTSDASDTDEMIRQTKGYPPWAGGRASDERRPDGHKPDAADPERKDSASTEKPLRTEQHSDGSDDVDGSDANSGHMREAPLGLQTNQGDDGFMDLNEGKWELADVCEYSSRDNDDDLDAVREAEIDRLAQADAKTEESEGVEL